MYLDKIKPFNLGPNYDLDFLEDLKNHKFFITYTFNPNDESIIYRAIEKGNFSKASYASIKVMPNGNCFYNDARDLVLEKFLVDYEKTLQISDKNKIYEPILNSISALNNLNENELSKRVEARSKFDELIKNIEVATSKENDFKERYNVKVIMERYYSSDLGSSISFGIEDTKTNKFAKITSINQFKSCLYEKSEAKVGSFIFPCVKSSFTKEGWKICKVINSLTSFIDGRFYNFKDEDVFAVLKALNGNYLYYLNQKNGIPVEYVDKPKISFDKEGNISLEPFVTKKDDYTLCEKGLFIFDKKRTNIKVVSFIDEIYYYLYKFLIENSEIKMDYVQDLIRDKLLPLIESKSEIDEEFKEKIGEKLVKIRLFVDYEKDQLLFKTKYFVGINEINREEAFENASYQNKILNYDIALNFFNIPENGAVSDDQTILNFLTTDLSNIKKYADILLSDELTGIKVKKPPTITIHTKLSNNLLDLNVSSDEYSKEEIEEILNAFRRKKKFIKLHDSIIQLNGDEVEVLKEIDDDFNIKKEDHELPLYEIFKLGSYKENANVNFDEKIENILKEIQNFKKSDFKPLPKFDGVLRNYQVDAFKWLSILHKYNLGGILADDMGLGKTLEMISFISSLKEEKPILIVSPKSLAYNWEHEFKMWNKDIKVVVLAGIKEERINLIRNIDNNKKVVYVTPYDSLRNDVNLYEEKRFSLCILDEAQYIKNVNALKTKAIKKIKSDNRFVLTGTPIENSLVDLWSIFDFLMPNYLYSFDKFRTSYENNIINGDEKSARRLQAKITPFILRRVKKDVLKDLPPKIESVQVCGMKNEQRKIYDAYYLKTKSEFASDPTDKIGVLAALTRLRQICVDPSMFLENFEDVSEKLEVTINLVNDAIANDHKLLIFSSFTTCLEHLRNLLEEIGIDSYYICGDTNAKDRLMYCELFNKTEDVKVFFISLKAGGTGLNLTGADMIIHLDPWWNVAAENQASDRAHRIGQKRTVNVIKLVTKDSIEEKVIELQEIKKDLMDNFIGQGDKGANYLSSDDIKFLLD